MRASFVPPHPTPGEYRSGAPGEGRSRPTVAEFIQMVLCRGGERSFAVEAGREVRILVRPEEIDDHTATRLARDIVKKIEEQLTYPGQIKVTVIRETRAAEYPK